MQKRCQPRIMRLIEPPTRLVRIRYVLYIFHSQNFYQKSSFRSSPEQGAQAPQKSAKPAIFRKFSSLNGRRSRDLRARRVPPPAAADSLLYGRHGRDRLDFFGKLCYHQLRESEFMSWQARSMTKHGEKVKKLREQFQKEARKDRPSPGFRASPAFRDLAVRLKGVQTN